jgi:hypothetical protein
MKILNFAEIRYCLTLKLVNLIYVDIGTVTVGRDSPVGIATRYRLDGPLMESRRGARFSSPVQTGPCAHLALCTVGTESLSWG